MQFPESWLRAFCNPALTTQQLAELLTMSGLEVEELRAVASPFHGIVVAEIVKAEQHPNADKLRVCKVDAGGPELLQIVCGAPNARNQDSGNCMDGAFDYLNCDRKRRSPSKNWRRSFTP